MKSRWIFSIVVLVLMFITIDFAELINLGFGFRYKRSYNKVKKRVTWENKKYIHKNGIPRR